MLKPLLHLKSNKGTINSDSNDIPTVASFSTLKVNMHTQLKPLPPIRASILLLTVLPPQIWYLKAKIWTTITRIYPAFNWIKWTWTIMKLQLMIFLTSLCISGLSRWTWLRWRLLLTATTISISQQTSQKSYKPKSFYSSSCLNSKIQKNLH